MSDAERGLVEHLRDQAHVLVDQDLAAVAHRDAGRLLAAVLEGVEPEVGQLGDVLAGRPDAEDAAGVLGSLVVRVEGRGQPAVATLAGADLEGHVCESRAAVRHVQRGPSRSATGDAAALEIESEPGSTFRGSLPLA